MTIIETQKHKALQLMVEDLDDTRWERHWEGRAKDALTATKAPNPRGGEETERRKQDLKRRQESILPYTVTEAAGT